MTKRVLGILVLLLAAAGARAQMFTDGVWEQKNLATAKVSELYGEVTLGINVRPQHKTANFVYFALGYGKPTKRNPWRKFTPKNNVPDGLTDELTEKLGNNGTSHLHGGKIGVGWMHWFNHIIGCYAQAGWGFIADLSTNDDLTQEEKALLTAAGMKDKTTFVYNTVPVELGVTLNVWKHYHGQVGFTYMWKEIPLITFGIGYAF